MASLNIPALLDDPSRCRSIYDRMQQAEDWGVLGISEAVMLHVIRVMEQPLDEAVGALRFQVESPVVGNQTLELKEVLWNIAQQADIYTSNLIETEYDRAVGQLFEQSLPFGSSPKEGRTSLLTWAYSRLQSMVVSSRSRDLILALLETFGPLSQRLLSFKHHILDDLVNERRSLQSEFIQILRSPSSEGDEKIRENLIDLRGDIRSLDSQINSLAHADLWKSLELLKGFAEFQSHVLAHRMLPLEGAFIRQEYTRRAGNWDHFRVQCQTLFSLSEGQVNAAKAWRSASLEGAEASVEELVRNLLPKDTFKEEKNPKLLKGILKDDAPRKVRSSVAEHPVDLENLYVLWSDADAGRLNLIRAWQPQEAQGCFARNEAFRCWVYVLTSLPPFGFVGDFLERVALLFGMEPHAFKSMLAHFHGAFRVKIQPGSLKDKAIQAVDGFGSMTEVKEITVGGENSVPQCVKDERDKFSENQSSEIVLDHFPEAVSTSESVGASTPSRIEVIKSFGREGDVFDYDTRMKGIWRGEWGRFIEDRVSRKGRKHLKVACLPGQGCLEIPGYLDAGFDPKNIYGFESSERVRREFLANAARYGINGIPTSMKDTIAQYGPFDVVMLDFPGPVSRTTMGTLQALPLVDEAVVGVNVLARRDSKLSGFWHALASPDGIQAMLSSVQGLGSFSHGYNVVQNYKLNLSEQENPLAVNRFEGYPYLVGAHTGIDSFHSWLFRQEISNSPFLKGKAPLDVGGYIAAASLPVFDYFTSQFKQLFFGLPDAFDIVNSLRMLFLSALRGQSLVTAMEQMSYQSEKSGSPYLTAMLQLHRPAQFYRRNQAIFRPFLMDAMNYLSNSGIPISHIPNLKFDASRAIYSRGGPVKFKPLKLEIYYPQPGGRRDSFSLKQLIDAMTQYQSILAEKVAMPVPKEIPVRRLTL